VELKKGETIMIDVALQLPAYFLHEAFSNCSGVPLHYFELYYRGTRLEGEAALMNWGVEKDSTIEVKMRGRGGVDNTDTINRGNENAEGSSGAFQCIRHNNASALLAAKASASTSGLKAKKLGGVDPRWDVDGFGAWLAGCPCVSVSFLRATKPVGRHQVPEDEWVTELPPGAGIDGVQMYAILSAAFGTQRSPELAASELAALLQALEGDQVHEDDLVWWDCLALSTGDGDNGRAEAFRAFTTYKAQCVVLPEIAGPGSTSVFACMEPMALLALSCFSQRIYNASNKEVKAGLDLSKFFDLSGLLMSLQRESDSQLAFVADMLEEVLTLTRTLTLTIALTLTLTLTP